MVGLRADQAGKVIAIFTANHHGNTLDDLLGNTSDPLDPQKSVGLDPADDKTDHIHMREYHQMGRFRITTRKGSNHIPCLVDHHLVGVFGQIILEPISHSGFIA
ncbi:hypothetical protein D3C71_1545050 [compost metagenome]